MNVVVYSNLPFKKFLKKYIPLLNLIP